MVVFARGIRNLYPVSIQTEHFKILLISEFDIISPHVLISCDPPLKDSEYLNLTMVTSPNYYGKTTEDRENSFYWQVH